jgi:uncharacterized protein
MPLSVVTGATAGLGAAFAEHLAAEGHDLILVARDAERLDASARTLSAAYRVGVESLPADLSDLQGLQVVEQRLADASRPVDLLVNNAGFSPAQPFIGGDLGREEQALDVMVRAVMRACHAALPPMVARGSGAVINVSSVAGWLPGGTYGAAKAWVTSFTEGLAMELRGSGVTATALCPGYVRTEFHERAGIDVSGIPPWAWLDARSVVAQAMRDARRGRPVSVPDARYQAARIGLKLAPSGLLRRAGRMRPSRPPQ